MGTEQTDSFEMVGKPRTLSRNPQDLCPQRGVGQVSLLVLHEEAEQGRRWQFFFDKALYPKRLPELQWRMMGSTRGVETIRDPLKSMRFFFDSLQVNRL